MSNHNKMTNAMLQAMFGDRIEGSIMRAIENYIEDAVSDLDKEVRRELASFSYEIEGHEVLTSLEIREDRFTFTIKRPHNHY